MGHIQMGIPEGLVLKLLRARPTGNFVETGTFRGNTTAWAAQHFRQVITIEISPSFSRAAAARLGHHSHIDFLVGDSAALMKDVVARLDGPAVFWLDGHYCGPGTGDVGSECPIMDELEALRLAPEPIILIDDARCFFGPPPPPHDPAHWVGIDIIFRYFAEHFPGHTVTVHDDVIIAVPKYLKPVLDEEWIQHFGERFSNLGRPPFLRRLVRKILDSIILLFSRLRGVGSHNSGL